MTPHEPRPHRRPLLPRIAAVALAAAGLPALARPPAPTPHAETPAAAARRALAERDVPFEAHAFVSAAADGDLPLVEIFLDAGMPASTRDRFGVSALVEAARADRPEILALLLSRGAKPGEAQGGEPPLVAAAEAGSLRTLSTLLSAGADPDQPADPAKGPGGTALQRACAAEAWEAARLLLEGGASATVAAPPMPPPLFLAAESGHAPTVSLLLAQGADPNARGPGGAAPIWLPVWNGHVEVVKLLLLAGADVRADRPTLLKGRPGHPVKPEIRRLLRTPPKPKPVATKPPAPKPR